VIHAIQKSILPEVLPDGCVVMTIRYPLAKAVLEKRMGLNMTEDEEHEDLKDDESF